MKRPSGYVLWEGERDGAPFAVIATGFGRESENSKTGRVIQSWIIRTDVPPHVAIRTGEDETICGDCKMRPSLGGPCYVKVFQAPLSVFKAYHRGNYPRATPAVLRGRRFRFGSYGDPSLIPLGLIRAITRVVSGWTGYTQQWEERPDLAPFFMASVHSESDHWRARYHGFRTFRVRSVGEPSLPGEVTCPASAEAGHKTTCSTCKLCNGRATLADRRRSIVINAHGAKVRRSARVSRLPVLA